MNDLFNLSGQTALITGGGGALGSAMALALAQAGTQVALLGRTASTLEQQAERIRQAGGQAITLIADVLEERQLRHAKAEVLRQWGRLDILVNAAGGNLPGATIGPEQSIFDLSLHDFAAVTDLNLKGTLLPTLAFGEIMAQQQSGCIVNISSMAAQRPLTRVLGYSAAKAAVDNLTKWLAVEIARKFSPRIRVNAIAPGFFVGEQNRQLLLQTDGSLTPRGQAIIAATPMGRFGDAEELGSTLVWLASKGSQFVTGIVVPVDGGFSAFAGV